MEISVIIATKNRAYDLAKLMSSLGRQTLLPDELVIVDGSKNNETRKMLTEYKKKAFSNFIYKKSEAGLTKQRNIGVNLASGQYLFFFDDDVILEDEFIKVIYDTFKSSDNHDVGGIMGKIVNISNSVKTWDDLIKKIFYLSDIGNGRVKLSGLPSIKIDNYLSSVESLSGGCTAYKKKVFDEFSFDENLKGYAYLEDVDFSFRVGKKYRLLFQPNARLRHFPSTYLKVNSRILRKQFIQHQTYLFRKNMPKDIPHYLGYWISLIGNLFYNGIIQRDLSACQGIVEGLLKPLKC